jgi:hypothetical protein
MIRAARHLVRKATKPLRLRLNAWQIEQSQGHALVLIGQREVANYLLQEEERRQVQLAAKRMQIERGLT